MSIYATLDQLGIRPEIGSDKIVRDIRRNHKGNAKLFHDIACMYGPWLKYLQADLAATSSLLATLDQVQTHDEVLDEATLNQPIDLTGCRKYGDAFDSSMPIELADWNGDGAHATLVATVIVCEQTVRLLAGAQEMVAGLFKGSMRDATEEPLSRSLAGARSNLAKMKAVLDQYEIPKRPYEIRRNALSYLVVSTGKIVRGLSELHIACDRDASPDLLLQLSAVMNDLANLQNRFEALRERCSQKMKVNLLECATELTEIVARIGKLAAEANVRWCSEP